MGFQYIFKRYELKYMITRKQQEVILQAIEPYMKIDKYGKTTIRNLYFDTDNYRLIRRSIEKPNVYKEKIRIRSYNQADDDTTVFVELKKKHKSIVYKRRVSLKEKDAMKWLVDRKTPIDTQIAREIDYFLDYYENLHPVLFLSYDRIAYYCKGGSDLRITFDDRILFREDHLSLKEGTYGKAILDEDKVLMEIKASGGMPLWLASLLSKEKIYKTPFSKYGTVYKQEILPRILGGNKNV